MQIEGLSWYPGHMTKTKRMIVAEDKIGNNKYLIHAQ